MLNLEKEVTEFDSVKYNETKNRTKLQNQLDETTCDILSFSNKSLGASKNLNRILDECNLLKQALQDLFKSYENKV